MPSPPFPNSFPKTTERPFWVRTIRGDDTKPAPNGVWPRPRFCRRRYVHKRTDYQEIFEGTVKAFYSFRGYCLAGEQTSYRKMGRRRSLLRTVMPTSPFRRKK